MTMEMTCRTCGEPFTPTGPDIIAGPDTYWYCPSCRREQLGGYVDGDQGREIVVEPADDPNAAHDRAALARADRLDAA